MTAKPSGAAANAAPTCPPSASRTEVVVPQNGQGTPVVARNGQGRPQVSGRCAAAAPPTSSAGRDAQAAEVELVPGGRARSHCSDYSRGSRLNACLGTVTT